MLYKIGRFLQLVGMLMLPIAMAGNLIDKNEVELGKMLTVTAIGVSIFLVGYLLQQAGKKT